MDRENFLKILESKTKENLPIEAAFENVFRIFYEYILETFKRDEEEVAIFVMDDREILKFLYPLYFRKSGSIPSDYKKSFVGKIISAKKGFIDNDFETSTHLVFFEKIRERGDKEDFDKRLPIKKIMGAPLIKDEKVFGVVEVSKKGKSGEKLKNFSKEDLKLLEEIISESAEHLFKVYKNFILK